MERERGGDVGGEEMRRGEEERSGRREEKERDKLWPSIIDIALQVFFRWNRNMKILMEMAHSVGKCACYQA